MKTTVMSLLNLYAGVPTAAGSDVPQQAQHDPPDVHDNANGKQHPESHSLTAESTASTTGTVASTNSGQPFVPRQLPERYGAVWLDSLTVDTDMLCINRSNVQPTPPAGT